MEKTTEELKKENAELKKALRENTSILRIIYHAWKYSNWQFPNVGGYRMEHAVNEGERLAGKDY